MARNRALLFNIVLFTIFCASSFGQVRFLPPVTYPVASPVIADLNGDGRPDMVALHSENSGVTIAALLGNGDGTFQSAKISSLGGVDFPRSLAVGDVNGDGKPDLLVAILCRTFNDCRSRVGVMLGNGDGTFQDIVTYPAAGMYGSNVAVFDLDGDGKLDVVMTSSYLQTNCDHGVVAVLRGNGDGTFQPAQSYESGGCNAGTVAIADSNADGIPDLLVVNGCIGANDCSSGAIGVLLGNGDGSFRVAQSYSSIGLQAGSLAVADLNGDGKLDVAVANDCVFCDSGGTIAVLLGKGDGTFRTARIFSSGAYLAASIAIADINLDRKPDLIVAACVPGPARCFGPSGTIFGKGVASVLLGNGDGTFQPAQKFGSGGYVGESVVVADLNGDNKPDLIVGNICASTYCRSTSVDVLLNVTGVFTSTRLRSSLNPSIYGQKAAFSATVVPSEPSTPTGQVVFKVKELTGFTFNIGRATLDSSRVATLIKSNLNADAYQVTAVYLGDTMNQGSVSPVLNQLVTETTTTAQISSSPNPSAQGQIVTFTATITSPTVTPTGPVTFSVGKQVLGTAQIVPWAHKATFATSTLPVGSTRVTATYFGNSNVARSSASLTQVVH